LKGKAAIPAVAAVSLTYCDTLSTLKITGLYNDILATHYIFIHVYYYFITTT